MYCCGPLNGVCHQPRYCATTELGSRVWPFRVKWRHRSRDRLIAHMSVPIGGPWNGVYLQPLLRYYAL